MKILIVDDHSLFREGLCYVLNKLDDHVDIVQASTYDEAIQAITENNNLDLVLLDLSLPGKSGFSLLDKIITLNCILPVVILSASEQSRDINRAKAVGAMGYILKSTTSVVMLSTLRLILSGGLYFPSVLNNNKLSLTPRQVDVLDLLIEGNSNKLIAARMSVAEATVKMHITAIFKSLGVTNRTQAVIAAKEQEYV